MHKAATVAGCCTAIVVLASVAVGIWTALARDFRDDLIRHTQAEQAREAASPLCDAYRAWRQKSGEKVEGMEGVCR